MVSLRGDPKFDAIRSDPRLLGLSEMEEKSFVDPFLSAVIHTSLGNTDEAFAWLNKADPRFADLVRRMGL